MANRPWDPVLSLSAAVAYVSTIFLLYLIGLGIILVHYMNSSYGSWTWNLDDLWEELRPTFSKPKPKWETKTRGECGRKAICVKCDQVT